MWPAKPVRSGVHSLQYSFDDHGPSLGLEAWEIIPNLVQAWLLRDQITNEGLLLRWVPVTPVSSCTCIGLVTRQADWPSNDMSRAGKRNAGEWRRASLCRIGYEGGGVQLTNRFRDHPYMVWGQVNSYPTYVVFLLILLIRSYYSILI